MSNWSAAIAVSRRSFSDERWGVNTSHMRGGSNGFNGCLGSIWVSLEDVKPFRSQVVEERLVIACIEFHGEGPERFLMPNNVISPSQLVRI